MKTNEAGAVWGGSGLCGAGPVRTGRVWGSPAPWVASDIGGRLSASPAPGLKGKGEASLWHWGQGGEGGFCRVEKVNLGPSLQGASGPSKERQSEDKGPGFRQRLPPVG